MQPFRVVLSHPPVEGLRAGQEADARYLPIVTQHEPGDISMRNCWTALAWTIVLTITGIPSASASEVLMIFDSSASMEERTSDGVRRIDGAKAAFQSLVPKLSNQQVGLIVFGHRVAANTDGCCEDIERIIPIGEFSSGAFNDAVMRLQPTGNTPLAQSLMTARDVLVSRGQKSPASRDVPKAIVVLTDGT